jgi:broad specificity phosphatase PhoE
MLVLVRHGQTDANARGLLLGRADPPLSELGRHQAAALAAHVPAAVWREWRADPHYVPPGGESLAMLGTRVRAACDDLLEEARERDVVVVSHVSPIKAAIGWALGAGDEIGWHMFVQLASIARIAIGPWGPSLHSFNETA